MAKTTVVIPNYNGIRYIGDCLNSLNAGNTGTEIVVVDNASSDGSYELVKAKFPKVRLLRLEENTGFCHAVNEGIRLCETEYIFVLNNDTKVCPDTIERLERTMDKHPKALAVQAGMRSMDDNLKIDSDGDMYCALGWAFALHKDKRIDSIDVSRGVHRVFSACGGAVLYRKKVLDAIGYFDENHFAYLEDVDLGYRGRIFGYRSYVDLDAVVYHKGSGASGSRHNEFKVSLSSRNSIYLIGKNMPIVQILINLPFLLIGYLIKTVYFMKKGLAKTYLKGIVSGMRNLTKPELSRARVRFKLENLPNYLKIQGELWINILRRV